eukprot:TRINITY_DN89_c0_g1_i1.p1 TRINITY_DN89_c0_g1~~TRINITY_DN89_c0_g1_i1.p1  ORF type:complete len:456 (+),score=58.56 TRINITY_DN89_c0_g1_i1:112-1479(+)
MPTRWNFVRFLAVVLTGSLSSFALAGCGKMMEECGQSKCCEDYGFTCKQKHSGGYAQCRPTTEQCPPQRGQGENHNDFWTCVDMEKSSGEPQVGTMEFALLYDSSFPEKKGQVYMKTPLYMKRHQIMWQQNDVTDFTFMTYASENTTSVLFEFLDWQKFVISAEDGRSPNGDHTRPFTAFGKVEGNHNETQKFLGAPQWIHSLKGCGGGYTLRATPYNQHGKHGTAKYFSVKLLPDCGCIDFEPLLKGMDLIVLDDEGRKVNHHDEHHDNRILTEALSLVADDGQVEEESDGEVSVDGGNLRQLQLTNSYGEVIPSSGQTLLKHGFSYVLDTNKLWPGKYFTLQGTECKTLDMDTISKVEWILMDQHRNRIKTEGLGFDESAPYTMFGDKNGTYKSIPRWIIENGGTYYVRALPYDLAGKPGPEDTAQDIKVYIVPEGANIPGTFSGKSRDEEHH